MSKGPRPVSSPKHRPSARVTEVLRLLDAGRPGVEIAAKLGISSQAVSKTKGLYGRRYPGIQQAAE